MQTIFHDKKAKQINYLDQRFYTYDSKTFYPSVTEILQVYPRGFGFEQWLKDVGSNAKEIVERAANFGSKIHTATEALNNGTELKWEEGYTIDEWKSILRFFDFWQKCSPKVIANEISLCSEKLEFGGTLDRVVEIAGHRYLIDIKTSNYIHKSHELQLSAYAMLWNEFNPKEPIEQTAILWLKSSNRTEKIDFTKSICQGVSDAGAWQLKFWERHYTDAFKIFQHTQALFKEENPMFRPLNLIFPDTISLTQ